MREKKVKRVWILFARHHTFNVFFLYVTVQRMTALSAKALSLPDYRVSETSKRLPDLFKMSDYCCGVKQPNKRCAGPCNGSVQTFLCVCEAPARFNVQLTQQREPVFDRRADARPAPRTPGKARTLWTHLRLDWRRRLTKIEMLSIRNQHL